MHWQIVCLLRSGDLYLRAANNAPPPPPPPSVVVARCLASGELPPIPQHPTRPSSSSHPSLSRAHPPRVTALEVLISPYLLLCAFSPLSPSRVPLLPLSAPPPPSPPPSPRLHPLFFLFLPLFYTDLLLFSVPSFPSPSPFPPLGC